jgi:hypothetical protein
MSTTPTPTPTAPAAPPAPRPPGGDQPAEIVIFSHSSLFYWWPVWVTGFLMAAYTFWAGDRMLVVPPGTRVEEVDVRAGADKAEKRPALVTDKGKRLYTRTQEDGTEETEQPRFFMAHSKNPGVLFVFVLLLVITITNIPLRGLWSVLILIVLVMLTIVFAQAGIWDRILSRGRLLAIHINFAGYLVIAAFVFGIWLLNFAFFDRQIYMIFTPGQMRVRKEIGGGETVFDTTGMVLHKQRSDLFRHWILGFGSGDLVVRPNNAQAIDLPNVLAVGRRVKEIERMLKERKVVTA